MTIVTRENNEAKTSDVYLQAQTIVNQFGTILIEPTQDTASIVVIYDDATLTPQQRATIISELAQLGIN